MCNAEDLAQAFRSLQATNRCQSGFPRLSWLDFAAKNFLLLFFINASVVVSAFATCTAPQNAIEAENCLAGNPVSDWYVVTGSPNIQGFTTDVSVNAGDTV